MTRITFRIASSFFAANISVKQNAIDHANQFPVAAFTVHTSLYVDDGLIGTDSLEGGIKLQRQVQELFNCGGFLLHKWKTNDLEALRYLSPDLLLSTHLNHHDPTGFAKALIIERGLLLDSFLLIV